ncbi:unnamed protein product [Symbiodinium natans]|uniref:Uncharacterized protein n=1 Tax=Symbiodinium natans TaxID=878477 RepID=A0A812LY57_9DINO|nr:unnamed protein product [Symbiodinium natans]
MRQLVLENQALREAFGDTQKRLMELEDERQCFLDEGVYDVVNSICGQTGLSPRAGLTGLMGDVDNSAAKTNGDGAAITFHIGSTDPSTDLLALAGSPSVLAGSPAALPLSPLSLAQMVARRSEQDLRSAELSGENEKLRRELERTTKILEVLEQQRHVAEDKMLALEQEHAVLVRRLAEMQTGVSNLELSPGESDIMDLEAWATLLLEKSAYPPCRRACWKDHARKGSESMSEVAVPVKCDVALEAPHRLQNHPCGRLRQSRCCCGGLFAAVHVNLVGSGFATSTSAQVWKYKLTGLSMPVAESTALLSAELSESISCNSLTLVGSCFI